MQNRRNFLKSSAALASLTVFGAAGAARAATEVSYWHHFTSQSEMAGLASVEAMFDATGNSVRSDGIPNADYMSKVTTASVANALPDSMMVVTDRLPDIAALGAIQPISDKIDGWQYQSDFTQSAWDGISLDGEIYGVPAFAFVNWAYYRKDWFDEAGIGVPDTFLEFQEAAIKLTDSTNNRYGFGLRGGDGGQSYLLDVIDSFGGINYEGDKASLDIPKTQEAMRWYSELATKHGVTPPSAANDSYRQIMEGFKTGQTAMLWHHTGSLIELTEAMEDGQIGTMIRPAGPAARIARVSYLYNSLTGQGDTQAAWDWIATWAEPDAAVAVLEATGYFPATTAVASDPRISENPIYAPAIETISLGIPAPKIVGFSAWLKNVVLPEYQKLLLESATVEEAVDRMAKELDKAMG